MKASSSDVIEQLDLYHNHARFVGRTETFLPHLVSLTEVPDESDDRSEAFSAISTMSLAPKFIESLGLFTSKVNELSKASCASIADIQQRDSQRTLQYARSQAQISISGSAGAAAPAKWKSFQKLEDCSVEPNRGSMKGVKPHCHQPELKLRLFACAQGDNGETDPIEGAEDDSFEANFEFYRQHRKAKLSLTGLLRHEDIHESDILPKAAPTLRKQPSSHIDQRKSILKSSRDCKYLTGDLFDPVSRSQREVSFGRRVVFSNKKIVYLFSKDEREV